MANPVFQQQTSGFTSSFGTTTLTTSAFGSSVTAGNAILVAFVVNVAGDVKSVTDSTGNNTYTHLYTCSPSSLVDLEFYLANNITTGGTGFTVNVQTNSRSISGVVAIELSGVAASGVLDASGTDTISSGSGTATLSATSNADDFILAMGSTSQPTGTWSAGNIAGSTGQGLTQGGTGSTKMATAYQNVTSTNSGYTANLTTTDTSHTGYVSAVAIAGVGGPADDNITVSDTEGTSESVGYYTDLVATREQVTIMVDEDPNVSDTEGTSENTQAQLVSFINVHDTEGTSENTVALIPFLLITVNDTEATSENIAVSTTGQGIDVNDTEGTSENVQLLIPTLFITVNDTEATSEALTIIVPSPGTDNIVVSDPTTTSENTVLLIPVLFIHVSDTEATSESTSVHIPGTTVTYTSEMMLLGMG